jgi:hypothetical protein
MEEVKNMNESVETQKTDEYVTREQVMEAIGDLGFATTYEIGNRLGCSLRKAALEEINQNIKSLQREKIVTVRRDNLDPSNLFTSITSKGLKKNS